MANSIKIWKTVERRIGGPFKFVTVHLYGTILILYAEIVHLSNPLGLLSAVIYMRTKFCLPASAYFVFLQLRSALKALWRSVGIFYFLSS